MSIPDLHTEVEIALCNLLKAEPSGITPQRVENLLADRFELTWQQAHQKME